VKFCDLVAKAALSSNATDVETLKGVAAEGGTVEELRSALVLKLGENIQLRRIVSLSTDGVVGAYVHGGRIGVLVDMKGGNVELARGVAMHVAAMNPPYNKASDVPADFVAKEKEIELAKMSDKDKAKPAEILEKIIGGKVAKILNDNTLYGQPYVVDTNMTVEAALKAAKADVASFHRLAVGEGIEKVVEDYAAEVAKAMQV
jgi:elongation factor Ts